MHVPAGYRLFYTLVDAVCLRAVRVLPKRRFRTTENVVVLRLPLIFNPPYAGCERDVLTPIAVPRGGEMGQVP